MDLNEEISILKKVLAKIKGSENTEGDFDVLYDLLKSELKRVGDTGMGSYGWNLKQTIDKQAHMYLLMRRKRPVKGSPSDYRSFIVNFKQDVTDKLMKLEYKSDTVSGQDGV